MCMCVFFVCARVRVCACRTGEISGGHPDKGQTSRVQTSSSGPARHPPAPPSSLSPRFPLPSFLFSFPPPPFSPSFPLLFPRPFIYPSFPCPSSSIFFSSSFPSTPSTHDQLFFPFLSFPTPSSHFHLILLPSKVPLLDLFFSKARNDLYTAVQIA